MTPERTEWLTPEEVAGELKIAVKTAKDWLRARKLAGYKAGRLWRVKRQDLDAFMKDVGLVARREPEPPAAAALLALVRCLLGEDTPTYLHDRGVSAFPLHQVNEALEPLGFVVHAAKVRDRRRAVACTGKNGRMEPFGVFELRAIEGR